jgi:hypothetical protein
VIAETWTVHTRSATIAIGITIGTTTELMATVAATAWETGAGSGIAITGIMTNSVVTVMTADATKQ